MSNDSRGLKMSKKILFLLFLLFVSIDGLKILGVIPFASKSHHNIGSSIVKTLAKAGHDVTLISGYPSKNPEPNFKDIKVAKIHEIFESGLLKIFLLKLSICLNF